MNIFTFTGRITKDPEFTLVEDKWTARISIAQNNGKKKEDGTYNSIFFDCTTWNETLINQMKSGESLKGRQVACIAKIMPKSWKDKDNKWHNKTNIFISELKLL